MTKRRQNIVDYVIECGDDDFWRRSFNDVDSLVLATLCYADLSLAPFGKIANFNCTIRELNELIDASELTSKMWNSVRGEQLLDVAAHSRRFGDILVHHYRHSVDPDEQKQFGAVTFSMNTDIGYVDYIAYQGTDDTLLGWKEDLNMSFASNLPAQREAVQYLLMIAELSDNKLILGGHSKGGNLATYAGLKSPRYLKNRIVAIYDHDGAGFLKGTFTALQRIGVAGKVHKTVPEQALFGLLLESYPGKLKVVKSDAKSIFQHDSLTWQVRDGVFQTVDRVGRSASLVARSVRRWLHKLTPEQRQQFVDDLYDVLSRSRNVTESGIKHYVRTHMRSIIRALRTDDPEVYDALSGTIRLLAKSSIAEIVQSVRGGHPGQ